MVGNATVVRQLRGVGRIAAELGVQVRESPGWTTRGRSSDLIITALLHHHTGATVDIDGLLIQGRPDLIGPLCNESLHRSDGLVLIASGRANHAGVGILPSSRSAGLEVTGPIPLTNTGPDAFPFNYDDYVRVSAAHVIYYGWPVDMLHLPAHKETARPLGRKVNPAFDMDAFRGRVADTVRRYRGGSIDVLDSADKTWLASWLQTIIDLEDYIINGRPGQLQREPTGRHLPSQDNNTSLSEIRRMLVGPTNPALGEPTIRDLASQLLTPEQMGLISAQASAAVAEALSNVDLAISEEEQQAVADKAASATLRLMREHPLIPTPEEPAPTP